ncbi:MAG TPA: polysaccharide deacetylase family protein [Pyrinomonadaceae bacterium]|nr:polysaccharide deacetylase family protein [Pyrinomonadaceae bacterium]
MKLNAINKAIIFLILIVSIISQSELKAQKIERFIAVTIDDLPVVSPRNDLKVRREITKNLLAKVKKAKVPAIGFVNEAKLYKDEKRDEAEIDLLRSWLSNGLELGNHTFSHMSLHDNSLADYKQNISKGEIITKELLEAKSLKMRYFRHPYLWTGLTMEIKNDLGAFLSEHNYTIAPVTVDNSDWIFASAYEKALAKNDKKLMKEIGAAYVPYMQAKMDYWERQSVKLFGREIKQILLLHANQINSEYFGKIAKMLEKRSYKFVTLENALTDDAYKLPDTFVKRNGISWLHRWALAKGKEMVLPDEPRVPEFVLKAAELESE